jgi:hypothetical protein
VAPILLCSLDPKRENIRKKLIIKGLKENEMKITAGFTHKGLETPESDTLLIAVGDAVLKLCSGFPI